jgi:hypothetical protein
MQDNKLAADEARRELQHESVKAQVEDDVNAEIAARRPHDARRSAEVGAGRRRVSRQGY